MVTCTMSFNFGIGSNSCDVKHVVYITYCEAIVFINANEFCQSFFSTAQNSETCFKTHLSYEENVTTTQF